MPVTTLLEESIKQGDFYVPHFEITVGGGGLPKTVLKDVVQVTYEDNTNADSTEGDLLDGFEIVVNNWDWESGEFLYAGSETSETLDPNSEKHNPLHKGNNPLHK